MKECPLAVTLHTHQASLLCVSAFIYNKVPTFVIYTCASLAEVQQLWFPDTEVKNMTVQ